MSLTASSLYTWGKSKYGNLGHSDCRKIKHPAGISALRSSPIVQISVNAYHSAVIVGQDIWTWGDGGHGQLGRGNSKEPQATPMKLIWGRPVSFLACGYNHTLAVIKGTGEVYSFGKNDAGQLGVGHTNQLVPVAVESLSKTRIAYVAAGSSVSAAITESGELYTWGKGDHGQLGIGNRISYRVPVLVQHPEVWDSIQFGSAHAIALTRSGAVYTWGVNSQCQLGLVSSVDRLEPTMMIIDVIMRQPAMKIVQISAGGFHSGALSNVGAAFLWGSNTYGQIGHGTVSLDQPPQQVELRSADMQEVRVKKIALGHLHSMLLTEDGRVYTFGCGDGYRLGLGDKKPRSVPTVLHLPHPAHNIFAGTESSAAVLYDSSFRPPTQAIAPGMPQKMRILVTSWNCNGKRPYQDVGEDWLLSHSNQPDIIAVGIQEIVKMRTDSVLMASATRMITTSENQEQLPWFQDLDRVLIPQGYARVGSRVLVGVLLAIYAQEKLKNHISDIHSAAAACGAMRGTIGNKGAVAIRFSVYGEGYCFVSSHLGAGKTNEGVERRNHDWKTIVQKIQFPQDKTMFDHEYLFWFGDLNYRLNVSRPVALKAIECKDWSSLLSQDQLLAEKRAGKTFIGFEEANINFAPTYKYDYGTTVYDTSEKQRVPAWCDRILYRGDGIHQSSYQRHELLESDHRPVSAIFYVGSSTPASIMLQKEQQERSSSFFRRGKRSQSVVEPPSNSFGSISLNSSIFKLQEISQKLPAPPTISARLASSQPSIPSSPPTSDVTSPPGASSRPISVVTKPIPPPKPTNHMLTKENVTPPGSPKVGLAHPPQREPPNPKDVSMQQKASTRPSLPVRTGSSGAPNKPQPSIPTTHSSTSIHSAHTSSTTASATTKPDPTAHDESRPRTNVYTSVITPPQYAPPTPAPKTTVTSDDHSVLMRGQSLPSVGTKKANRQTMHIGHSPVSQVPFSRPAPSITVETEACEPPISTSWKSSSTLRRSQSQSLSQHREHL